MTTEIKAKIEDLEKVENSQKILVLNGKD